MLFPRSFLVALLSAPLLALAQEKPNPFKIDPSGLQATAGQSLTLNWDPTTSGTVSLILRSGSSNDLAEGTTIAGNIQNSGHYVWDVPNSITRGSDYTIEIVSDSDSSATNYTPYFVLESTNTVASSTANESLGAPSTSLSMSTAMPTQSPSAFPLQSGVTIDTSAHPSSGSGAATATSTRSESDSSESSAMTSSSDSTATTMSTSTAASDSSAASASNDAVSTGSASTESSNGGAARATAMAGMLGVVALGALAL